MSNLPNIDEFRKSFNRVYDGADQLQREYDIVKEAQELNIPVDIYRHLYQFRKEDKSPAYPEQKDWWRTIPEWIKWFFVKISSKDRFLLSRKGIFLLVQKGVFLSGAIAIGHYIWAIPERHKQAHYQAWQVINLASKQQGSGGRIEALQELNNDGVSLDSLTANKAYLIRIKLENANMRAAHLQGTILYGANLRKANLEGALLQEANLNNVNLQKANLRIAKLQEAYLHNANLQEANLGGAIFQKADIKDAQLQDTDLCGEIYPGEVLCADFRGAKNLTLQQVKVAKNWKKAHYDPEFRKQLGLLPEKPEADISDNSKP